MLLEQTTQRERAEVIDGARKRCVKGRFATSVPEVMEIEVLLIT